MQKILLGIATAWPVVYIFGFIAFIFGFIAFAGGRDGGGEMNPLFAGGFVVLFLVHLVTIFLIMALTVFYIIHAVKNTKLDTNMRVIWIVLFFFGGLVANPIYWYLQIWREPKPEFGELMPPPASSWMSETPRQGSYVPPAEPPDWR